MSEQAPADVPSLDRNEKSDESADRNLNELLQELARPVKCGEAQLHIAGTGLE